LPGVPGPRITTTHQVDGGYPIVGHDAGVCTLTRIPEQHADQTLANCVAAVWHNGSLTVQGVVGFRSKQPESAVFAVAGGTGRFEGAAGTLGVSFTKKFKILTIRLKSVPALFRPQWRPARPTSPGRSARPLLDQSAADRTKGDIND
jgi:hypothetical protein